MNDYKAIVEKHSCKPNQGCGTATTCMCGLAEDMADEIKMLREALLDCHHVLHKLMGIVPGNDTAVDEMAKAMAKARSALGKIK
jgi:hypothetical protein